MPIAWKKIKTIRLIPCHEWVDDDGDSRLDRDADDDDADCWAVTGEDGGGGEHFFFLSYNYSNALALLQALRQVHKSPPITINVASAAARVLEAAKQHRPKNATLTDAIADLHKALNPN